MSSSGEQRYGRARILVTSIAERPRRMVVVERAVAALPVPHCPFTAYGCLRLQWVTAEGRDVPVIKAVPLERIERVLCVELDWADWVLRCGLKKMPEEVPSDGGEVADRRFFVNAFSVCKMWTCPMVALVRRLWCPL